MTEFNLQVSANCDEATVRDAASPLSKCPPPNPYIISAGYMSGLGEGQRGSGIRFQHVTIPQGATIDEVYLTFTAITNEDEVIVRSRISAEDVDNPGDFSGDTTGSFLTRFGNHTTAIIDWDEIDAWTTDSEYQSPEIKTLIQEIVNRATWVSGNSIVIFWEDFDGRSTQTGTKARRQGYPFNNTPSKATKLYISYTAAAKSYSQAQIIG